MGRGIAYRKQLVRGRARKIGGPWEEVKLFWFSKLKPEYIKYTQRSSMFLLGTAKSVDLECMFMSFSVHGPVDACVFPMHMSLFLICVIVCLWMCIWMETPTQEQGKWLDESPWACTSAFKMHFQSHSILAQDIQFAVQMRTLAIGCKHVDGLAGPHLKQSMYNLSFYS